MQCYRSPERFPIWLLCALLLLITACSTQPALQAASTPTVHTSARSKVTPTVRARQPAAKLEGTLLSTYKNHQENVLDVEWAPDNQRIASTDGAVLDIWNAFTGQQIFRYNNTNLAHIDHLSWSPDGRFIAFSDGVNVQIWDTQAKKQTFLLANTAPLALAWSPDDKYIASVSNGMAQTSVQVWNAINGQRPIIYTGILSKVDALSWSPDSQSLALGGLEEEDSAIVQIWHP
jgi:eukaryotic-like serine/threonine-protein kinase